MSGSTKLLWGGVRNDTAPWRWIEMKRYVICDEEGYPLDVTANREEADAIVEADPTLHIAVAEECEVVSIEKERK